MLRGIHQVNVYASQSHVWEYIRDMNAWAPLVPGYKEHTILSDVQSTWKFTVQYGVVSKKVHVKVLVTEWKESSLVKFRLRGINQKFTGEGFFLAEKVNSSNTAMTGCLTIESTSSLAKILESTFAKMVHELTRELTEAVRETIERELT
ncbi:SRPBCC family protein [Rossellomorea aquimaris]|uniref:SRPBCC family protein n=1 Tax=Rossellomorea aquimaris TaxID=189382 RepID=UPI0005C82378|nr:SRPBCC family protein [Rossellomorea aquimaris]